jgi:hypothetical protein
MNSSKYSCRVLVTLQVQLFSTGPLQVQLFSTGPLQVQLSCTGDSAITAALQCFV